MTLPPRVRSGCVDTGNRSKRPTVLYRPSTPARLADGLGWKVHPFLRASEEFTPVMGPPPPLMGVRRVALVLGLS